LLSLKRSRAVKKFYSQARLVIASPAKRGAAIQLDHHGALRAPRDDKREWPAMEF